MVCIAPIGAEISITRDGEQADGVAVLNVQLLRGHRTAGEASSRAGHWLPLSYSSLPAGVKRDQLLGRGGVDVSAADD